MKGFKSTQLLGSALVVCTCDGDEEEGSIWVDTVLINGVQVDASVFTEEQQRLWAKAIEDQLAEEAADARAHRRYEARLERAMA